MSTDREPIALELLADLAVERRVLTFVDPKALDVCYFYPPDPRPTSVVTLRQLGLLDRAPLATLRAAIKATYSTVTMLEVMRFVVWRWDVHEPGFWFLLDDDRLGFVKAGRLTLDVEGIWLYGVTCLPGILTAPVV